MPEDCENFFEVIIGNLLLWNRAKTAALGSIAWFQSSSKNKFQSLLILHRLHSRYCCYYNQPDFYRLLLCIKIRECLTFWISHFVSLNMFSNFVFGGLETILRVKAERQKWDSFFKHARKLFKIIGASLFTQTSSLRDRICNPFLFLWELQRVSLWGNMIS